MYYPSLKQFLKLSSRYNVIPVYKEVSADLDTPVSAFLKIDRGDYSFLLESVEGQEKVARYSFLGAQPALVIKSKGRNIEIVYPQKKTCRRFIARETPLDEIKRLMRAFRAAPLGGLPRFWGGMVGYMGYDFVRFFEDIPDKNPQEPKLFDAVFLLTDTLLVFDHFKHTVKIVNCALLPMGKKKASLAQKERLYRMALHKIDSVQRQFSQVSRRQASSPKSPHPARIKSNMSKPAFEAMVRKAKKYIKSGDIIQVVLSQRFQTRITQEPLDIYRKLRSLNPSPYMFYLKLNGVFLVGASPEMLVRCEDGIVQIRPIAGTRPRGKDAKADKRLEQELLADEKEKAEHLMLVDLGRNDLGRVSRKGKVAVSEFMRVEKYSHVMHLVSEVKGELDTKYDAYDVLRAAFPAGTVSGSPKIRAMEIIDELENTRRGPYAGCVGYFSFSHNMDTCITIRTILVKGNTAYIQAGAGIVADSVPQREYFETVNKAKALIEAIGR
jgi:anthranilate synthase component 1